MEKRKKPTARKMAEEVVARDRVIAKTKKEVAKDRAKYKIVLSYLDRTEKENNALKAKSGNVFKIPEKVGSKDSEAVAIVLASDWHIEELVRPEWVGGRNEYTLEIATERSAQFFQNTVRLFKKEQQDSRIETMVLWLGGDFISGNIHLEIVETAQLLPIEAMIYAERLIKSGIQHILDHTNAKLVIPCSAGNHSRITEKQRHATEVGNSLETIMYHHLAQHFAGNKRVQFILQTGYHTVVSIYDNFKIRFHHGHQGFNYRGGIGGLYIPARKAIAQWQKSEVVQFDAFGHWHNLKMDGDLFVCNGSMIGHTPYGLTFDYEKPKQAFFLIDKKRGRTGFFPITFNI